MREPNNSGAAAIDPVGRSVSGAWLVLLLATLLLTACDQDRRSQAPDDAGPIFRSVPAAEAQALIASRDELVLLDVRTPPERRRLRIADSRHVPLGEVMRGRVRLSGERPLLLICAVGGRSYVAASVLAKMGYREVYNLEGGIESWYRSGFPLEFGPEPVISEQPPEPGVDSD